MMIRNMDQIYKHAKATIVAMYSENDNAGLPGVSGISRILQLLFQAAHGSFVSSCPPVSTLIQMSKWATRGWTYQEARLSRQCLFFIEHQVYIVCRKTTGSEAIPSESQSCWISSLLNSSCLDAGLFRPKCHITNWVWTERLAFT